MYSFQLGNSFGNTSVIFFGGKVPYVFVFNWAIHLGMHRWFYFLEGKFLMYSFSIGQSFGNA